MPTPPLTTIQPSICPHHSHPYKTYCSHSSCIQNTRICQKCIILHFQHKKYITSKQQVIQDLTKGLKKCFQRIQEFDTRVQQLQQLINYTKNKSKEQYQNMECNLILQFKRDKEVLEEKYHKMEVVFNQISEKQRLGTYFRKLYNQNLLSLKIQLTNQEGMKQFKMKNDKFCSLLQKSNAQLYQKAYNQFNVLLQEFNYEIQNNTTFKVGQIIAMKNSKKQRKNKQLQFKKKNQQPQKPRTKKNQINIRKDQNENQQKKKKNPQQNALIIKNKEKQKPKTTTNIGEAIIGGILNFFNK